MCIRDSYNTVKYTVSININVSFSQFQIAVSSIRKLLKTKKCMLSLLMKPCKYKSCIIVVDVGLEAQVILSRERGTRGPSSG